MPKIRILFVVFLSLLLTVCLATGGFAEDASEAQEENPIPETATVLQLQAIAASPDEPEVRRLEALKRLERHQGDSEEPWSELPFYTKLEKSTDAEALAKSALSGILRCIKARDGVSGVRVYLRKRIRAARSKKEKERLEASLAAFKKMLSSLELPKDRTAGIAGQNPIGLEITESKIVNVDEIELDVPSLIEGFNLMQSLSVSVHPEDVKAQREKLLDAAIEIFLTADAPRVGEATLETKPIVLTGTEKPTEPVAGIQTAPLDFQRSGKADLLHAVISLIVLEHQVAERNPLSHKEIVLALSESADREGSRARLEGIGVDTGNKASMQWKAVEVLLPKNTGKDQALTDILISMLFSFCNELCAKGKFDSATKECISALAHMQGPDELRVMGKLMDIYVAKHSQVAPDFGITEFEAWAAKLKDPKGRFHARYQIARYWYKQKQYKNATREFERLLEDFPKEEMRPNVEFTLALCKMKCGDLEGCIDLLDRIQEKYPESPFAAKAIFAAGWTYLSQQRTEKAVAKFRQLLKKYPDCEYVTRAKGFVERFGK